MAERIGWAGMVIIVLAALLGVFSEGPLSRAEITDGQQTLHYQRMLRVERAEEMVLMAEGLPAGEEVVLHLGPELAGTTLVERSIPAADGEEGDPSGVGLRFTVPASGRLKVVLTVRPRQPGLVRQEIGLVGHAPLRFSQMIWP